MITKLIFGAVLFCAAASAQCTQAPCIGRTLPTAKSAIPATPYVWTGAATTNTCPSNGAAGAASGSNVAICWSNGAAWFAFIVTVDPSGNVYVPGSLTCGGTCSLTLPSSQHVIGSDSSGNPIGSVASDLSALIYAAGGGTAQAQTVTLTPAITSLTNGLMIIWKPTAANTGAGPTLAVSGLTAKPITKLGTAALVANDITTTALAVAVYDGTEFQLQNPQTGLPASAHVIGSNSGGNGVAATASDLSAISYIAGGGTAQAQTATFSPAVTALTTGLTVAWLPVASNTGAAPTLAVNGLTAKPITKLGTTALVANDLTTTAIAVARYDGTEFQLQNPQTSTGGGGASVGGVVAKTTNYAMSCADSTNAQMVTMNGSSLTLTLPATPCTNPWFQPIKNLATSALTLSPNGLTINGVSGSVSISSGQYVEVYTDGSNYFLTTPPVACGSGGTIQCTYGPNGLQLDASPLVATVQGANGLQTGGSPLLTVSTSANGTTYLSTTSTPLSAYADKQNLFWYADVTNSVTNPTLNIDSHGAKNLVKQDGSALAVNDIKATTLYRIWYDATGGTSIHVVEAGLGGGGSTYCYGPVNQTLVSTATSMTFSSIPGTCRNLIVKFSVRDNAAGTSVDNLLLQFNGDTGANYSWSYSQVLSSSMGVGISTSQTSMAVGFITQNGSTAGFNGSGTVTILNYADGTNFMKNVTSLSNSMYASDSSALSTFGGTWKGTIAPITSITFSGGTFMAGSTFTLIGEN